MRKHVDEVLQAVDISPKTWYEQDDSQPQSFDRWPSADYQSLFYLFNTLPSPNPSWKSLHDSYDQSAMKRLLDYENDIGGLLGSLYPYQRRAVAEMLRREASPELQLDPRLEERHSPTGELYYYNPRDRQFLRHPRSYDTVRGGILAETMGLGKTLMCLALILSTKGRAPQVPSEHTSWRNTRSEVGSLKAMTLATLARTPIPARKYFDDLEREHNTNMSLWKESLDDEAGYYEILPVVIRSHRYSTFSSPPEHIRLCRATLVVVPKNLVHQWKAELAKHVEDGALRVLVMENRSTPIPSPDKLAQYDVVLFSRPRFEVEAKSAGEELCESPLKKLHWLRIIIDEGHGISSTTSNAAVVAENIVRAERRWVVSGTPAKDLMGVEVELSALTTDADMDYRSKTLEHRREFNAHQEESSGALKALGQLASRFLKVQPWTTSSERTRMGDTARWEDYVYRHESASMKTHSGFSTCLKRTLEGLVVKTRPEDVERDIELPPLTHNVVRLQPSFFDKVTANLFVLLILSNAITSERQDMDYLFHKNSQHHLHRLIASLRQSGFYWTSIDETMAQNSIDVAVKYLAKEGTKYSDEDITLIEETAAAAEIAMNNPVWKAVTRTSEMGVFTDHWPDQSVEAWSFVDCSEPMAMGLTHAFEAQRFLNKSLSEEDPSEGFNTKAGEIKTALAAHNAMDQQQEVYVPKVMDGPEPIQPNATPNGAGAASSSAAAATPFGHPTTSASVRAPRHPRGGTKKAPKKPAHKRMSIPAKSTEDSPSKKKKRKRDDSTTDVELSPKSALGRASITGTTSAKLSYLLSRVLELHTTEKVLIFYDADFIAYYLATALDLFHIKYLLFSIGISNERRGKHLVLFNEDPAQRVMLMDIKQASHGLNVSTASRVFFVNPVCRPNIEAQAIKRAHRIGQTKPVHVETLVLKGTVEEAMHDRSVRMTSHEHLQAKTLEDDLGVARIIQSARILPITTEEMDPAHQMAKLSLPQQIFGRPGRGANTESTLEKEVFGSDVEDEGRAGKRRKGKETEPGEGKGKGKKVVIKDEPLDDPIPWQASRDDDFAPRSSIFGGR